MLMCVRPRSAANIRWLMVLAPLRLTRPGSCREYVSELCVRRRVILMPLAVLPVTLDKPVTDDGTYVSLVGRRVLRHRLRITG